MSDPNSNAVVNPLSRLPAVKSALYVKLATFWSARVDALNAQLVMLEASPVESYSFSAGEGQQQELEPKTTGNLRPGERLRIETPGGGGYGHA